METRAVATAECRACGERLPGSFPPRNFPCPKQFIRESTAQPRFPSFIPQNGLPNFLFSFRKILDGLHPECAGSSHAPLLPGSGLSDLPGNHLNAYRFLLPTADPLPPSAVVQHFCIADRLAQFVDRLRALTVRRRSAAMKPSYNHPAKQYRCPQTSISPSAAGIPGCRPMPAGLPR